jgi:hypothetical protein
VHAIAAGAELVDQAGTTALGVHDDRVEAVI